MKTLQLFTLNVWLLTFAHMAFAQEYTRIDINTILLRGDDKHARNQRYKLSMQDDGNLVIYQFENQKLTPIWASGTNNKGGDKAMFQSDGNLVIYNFDKRPIWASNTEGRGAYMLFQDDGNLVMYDKQDRYVWSTKPMPVRIEAPPATERRIRKGAYMLLQKGAYSPNKRYQLALQDDGDLTLNSYVNGARKVIWSSKTTNRQVKYGRFQDDGNLVLYDLNDKAVWASNTDGRGAYLSIQNDGNVVIYDANDKPIWSTDTWER